MARVPNAILYLSEFTQEMTSCSASVFESSVASLDIRSFFAAPCCILSEQGEGSVDKGLDASELDAVGGGGEFGESCMRKRV